MRSRAVVLGLLVVGLTTGPLAAIPKQVQVRGRGVLAAGVVDLEGRKRVTAVEPAADQNPAITKRRCPMGKSREAHFTQGGPLVCNRIVDLSAGQESVIVRSADHKYSTVQKQCHGVPATLFVQRSQLPPHSRLRFIKFRRIVGGNFALKGESDAANYS